MSEPATELASTEQLASYRARDAALLVASAEAAVRAYCGWHVAPSRSESFTVDGTGSHVLALPTMHLTAVESITENDADVATTTVQWSAAGYLWRAQPWTTRLRGVAVTATHGYATVPAEVRAVVLDVAELLAHGQGGATRHQVGQVSVAYAEQQLTALHAMVLDRYRLPLSP